MYIRILVHLSEKLHELHHFYSNFDNSVQYITKFTIFSQKNQIK